MAPPEARRFAVVPQLGGSLFLFDRKVLRYFRKDAHNWRKKKDGKTVKEAHERLKSGSIDVLHCYYAHGEDNGNFQRRTYWMLEEDFMHIVLVHYLETKGGKSSRARGDNDMLQAAVVDSPLSQLPSQTIEGESSLSGHASEYEEAESDIYSGGAGYNSFTQMQQHQNGVGPVIHPPIFSSYGPASSIGTYPVLQHAMVHNTNMYSGSQDSSSVLLSDSSAGFIPNSHESHNDLSSWNEDMKSNRGFMPHLQPPVPLELGTSAEGPAVEYLTFDEVYSDGLSLNDISAARADGESFWQNIVLGLCLVLLVIYLTKTVAFQFSSATGDSAMENSFAQNNGYGEAAISHPFLKTKSSNLSDILKDSFKKSDSFTRWMSNELPDVEDSQIQSSSGAYWNSEEADSIIEASSRSVAENLIKEKLHVWLLHKAGDGGKGPSVVDDEGQGVLHLAAALGYDWAIRPTVASGVNINFRDVHGWTALHWAAFCGRERTVVALIALGAAPGALTDPTLDFPGSTPADLASANGHRGISGFPGRVFSD
ncbi:hypothetical protein ACQ4PT_044732 [Festuca glaucescens]